MAKKNVTPSAKAAVAAAPALAPLTVAPAKRTPVKDQAPAPTLVAEPVIPLHVLHDEIRSEAYDYYIQRNYRAGDPMADWHRAEDVVLRRHGLR